MDDLMPRYDITLTGCDDSQTVTAELTLDQLKAVQHIGALTVPGHESTSCMPELTVTSHVEVITSE